LFKQSWATESHRLILLSDLLHENHFITPGTILGVMKGRASGLFYVLKKKRLEKQSVDFSKDLINLSRRELKIKIVLKINVLEKKFPVLIAVEPCRRRSAGKIATDEAGCFG
jgi:hypothetical protein